MPLDTGNAVTALQIIDESLSDAYAAQARIGSFGKYTLDSAANLLGAQEENLSLAYSDIMDTDVAEESARLTRWSLLQESGLQALSLLNSRNASLLDFLQSFSARL